MTDRTPTTEDVLSAYLYACHEHRRGGLIAEFNRWLDQTLREAKAEAWDEGFADGVNHDLGDWENAPSIINNPYRQKEK